MSGKFGILLEVRLAFLQKCVLAFLGLVNKVVPLEQLEDEYVQWAEEMMQLSPLALRMIKAGLNAELDGQSGIQELAGDATLLTKPISNASCALYFRQRNQISRAFF